MSDPAATVQTKAPPVPTGQVLDVNTKHKTAYCIPLWLRDEQIKQAIERVPGRIEKGEKLDDPVAVVCYGPSLKKTWEEIRNFKTVVSGSGSHKFLIERGIVPTYHVEVDPRAHKVELMGTPHPDVKYLIASTCCSAYFDHLEKHLGPEKFKENVLLWHVFDNADDGLRVLPPNEWAITGGSNVGLRQLSLAVFYGFRDLHVFGMDGCMDEEGSHAAAHPNQPPAYHEVEIRGKKFKTTQAYLECAKQTFHELDMLGAAYPAVKATFHGEGLVQTMAETYQRQPPPDGVLAFVGYRKYELISAEYRGLQARLHKDNLAYGVGGGKYAQVVISMCENAKTHSVLDYGCGKGYLAKALPFPIWEYDPAIPGKDAPPRPADIVICNDVLEHIEPDKIGAVLDDLRRVTLKYGFFVIHTGPASKTLADGRNAHILQKDAMWWKGQLANYFTVGKIKQAGPLVYVTVAPHATRAGKRKAVTA